MTDYWKAFFDGVMLVVALQIGFDTFFSKPRQRNRRKLVMAKIRLTLEEINNMTADQRLKETACAAHEYKSIVDGFKMAAGGTLYNTCACRVDEQDNYVKECGFHAEIREERDLLKEQLRAARAEERERCAEACREEASRWLTPRDDTEYEDGAMQGATNCMLKIRALGDAE